MLLRRKYKLVPFTDSRPGYVVSRFKREQYARNDEAILISLASPRPFPLCQTIYYQRVSSSYHLFRTAFYVLRDELITRLVLAVSPRSKGIAWLDRSLHVPGTSLINSFAISGA